MCHPPLKPVKEFRMKEDKTNNDGLSYFVYIAIFIALMVLISIFFKMIFSEINDNAKDDNTVIISNENKLEKPRTTIECQEGDKFLFYDNGDVYLERK